MSARREDVNIKFFLLPAIIDGYYNKFVIKYRNLKSDHEY